MVKTSMTRGTFVSVKVPWLSNVEARIGRAEFLAPLIRTTPSNRRSPWMRMLSIRRALRRECVRCRRHPSGTEPRTSPLSRPPCSSRSAPANIRARGSNARRAVAGKAYRPVVGDSTPDHPHPRLTPGEVRNGRLPAAAYLFPRMECTEDCRRSHETRHEQTRPEDRLGKTAPESKPPQKSHSPVPLPVPAAKYP